MGPDSCPDLSVTDPSQQRLRLRHIFQLQWGAKRLSRETSSPAHTAFGLGHSPPRFAVRNRGLTTCTLVINKLPRLVFLVVAMPSWIIGQCCVPIHQSTQQNKAYLLQLKGGGFDVTLGGMLNAQATVLCHQPFMKIWKESSPDQAEAVSYSSFVLRVSSAQHFLEGAGVMYRCRVAALSHPTAQYFAAAMAVICIGASVVNLNWRFSLDGLMGMIQTSSATVLMPSGLFHDEVHEALAPRWLSQSSPHPGLTTLAGTIHQHRPTA